VTFDDDADDGLPLFTFEGAALPRFLAEWTSVGGMGLAVVGGCALVSSAFACVLHFAFALSPSDAPSQSLGALIAIVVGSGVIAWAGATLARRAYERVAWLWVEDGFVDLKLSVRGQHERALWSELRKVEFRRTELRFTIARRGFPPVRRVLTIGWGRAEEFVRMKNYFVERMEAARAEKA
jgi:hypothetical protein